MANHDFFGYGLHDLPLFLGFEARPAGVKSLRFGEHFLARKPVYPPEIEFRLEPRNVLFELLATFVERLVEPAEPRTIQLSVLVKPVNPVDFLAGLLKFALLEFKEILLFDEIPIRLIQELPNLVRGKKVILEFLAEDLFQVDDWNLVSTLPADVFRAIRGNGELFAASTEGKADKEVDRSLGWGLLLPMRFLKHEVAAVPNFR